MARKSARDMRRSRKKIRARRSLIDFTEWTFPDYQRNWHHELVASKLDEFVRHECRRLIVSMPPRRGKSELCSIRLPSYILGRRPDAEIIVSSYSDTLATDFSRDAKRVVRSERYKELFPETRIPAKHSGSRSTSFKSSADHWETIDHGGRYLARGVDSSITGFGADYIVADDLLKGRKAAQSKTIRDGVWEFLQDDLFTRAEFPCSILVVGTRWHHDDPIGRLIEESADDWEVLRLPKILTEDEAEHKHPEDPRDVGETLWPRKHAADWEYLPEQGETPDDVSFELEREPSPVTLDELHERGRQFLEDEMRDNPRGAWALHQGQPKTDEGDFFEIDDFRQYHSHPTKVDVDKKLISVDCTFTDASDSDFVVAQVWGKRGVNFFLLDQVRERMGFKETTEAVVELASKWPEAYTKIVEGKANGDAVLEILEDKLHGLKRFTPSASKEERAQIAVWEAGDGHVHLPTSQVAPWISEFKREVKRFPNGSNDDQVDAFSQAMIFWTHSRQNDPKKQLKRVLGR